MSIEPETKGQYTGLQDRSGVKIFEGDIVTDGIISGIVYWHKWHASFYYGDGKSMVHYDELKIIGNFNDNPELLEEK